MPLLFFAYANSNNDPLSTLSEEDERVYQSLVTRIKAEHIHIHRESHATHTTINENLITFRDELTVFSYSGHAGRDHLLIDDQESRAEGVIQLLAQCPNLRLVILNGCSTVGQVDQLLALEQAPVVIATSAPVNDYAATQFAVSFFQAFSEQYTSISQAFEFGIAAARTRRAAPIELAENRGLAARERKEEESDQPIWGLHYREGHEFKLEWSIPIVYPNGEATWGNGLLVNKLLEAIAPFHAEIKALYDDEMAGQEISMIKKRRAILQNLPHPISQHLRKLLVEREEGMSEYVFYDIPGKDRLQQLITSYKSVVELPAFILLAQLWDTLYERKKLVLTAEQQTLLKSYLTTRTSNRIQHIFFPLIKVLITILQQNQVPIFVDELVLLEKDLEGGSDLFNACMFFERIYNAPAFSEEKAKEYCVVGEDMLAKIMGKFGFFTNYTLISIKNVRVKKNRFVIQPEFQHRLVELIQRFVGLEPSQLIADHIIDDSSIHLQKKDGNQQLFLNLSPFIIDMYAFDDTAQEAKLYYFEGYEKVVDACSFRHVYKPQDNLLLLKSEMLPRRDKHWQLRIFKHQFDAFSRLLFNQPLNDL